MPALAAAFDATPPPKVREDDGRVERIRPHWCRDMNFPRPYGRTRVLQWSVPAWSPSEPEELRGSRFLSAPAPLSSPQPPFSVAKSCHSETAPLSWTIRCPDERKQGLANRHAVLHGDSAGTVYSCVCVGGKVDLRPDLQSNPIAERHHSLRASCFSISSLSFLRMSADQCACPSDAASSQKVAYQVHRIAHLGISRAPNFRPAPRTFSSTHRLRTCLSVLR